jgi:hypothetical protein
MNEYEANCMTSYLRENLMMLAWKMTSQLRLDESQLIGAKDQIHNIHTHFQIDYRHKCLKGCKQNCYSIKQYKTLCTWLTGFVHNDGRMSRFSKSCNNNRWKFSNVVKSDGKTNRDCVLTTKHKEKIIQKRLTSGGIRLLPTGLLYQ